MILFFALKIKKNNKYLKLNEKRVNFNINKKIRKNKSFIKIIK